MARLFILVLKREHRRRGGFRRGHGRAQRARPRRPKASSPGGAAVLTAGGCPAFACPPTAHGDLSGGSSRPGSPFASARTGPGGSDDARCIPSFALAQRERLVRSAMGRPGLALRGHPELAPDSRGAHSLPRPDPRGPLRGSTALGLPARPPAPGLRLPGAQDPSHGVPAPRCAPLTVGSEAGLLGPSPRVASELRIRDVPRGEETPARRAVAPPGHALVLQLPPRPAGRDSGLAP